MSALLALLVQAAWWPTLAPVADSVLAANLYVDGCLRGKVDISNGRGRVLSNRETLSLRNSANWMSVGSQVKVVRFAKPGDTDLILIEYAKAKSQKFARSCILVSRKLNIMEARRAFVIDTGARKPREWQWNAYYPNWELDVPDHGYRKFLRVNDDRTVELEFMSYVDPSSDAVKAETE